MTDTLTTQPLKKTGSSAFNHDKLRLIVAMVVPLIVLIFGTLVMLSRYAYAEDGHNIILTIYIVGCILLFFALRKVSVVFIALLAVLLVGSQVYASQKFNWRQDYIDKANSGHPFPLEEMITAYPTYEEHIFSFLGAQDWVRFNNDCIQPALTSGLLMDQCRTPQEIQDRYRIDIFSAMGDLKHRMQNTAKRLEQGKLSRRSEYMDCIARKECATIPLLPKGVDATKLDPMSKDYIEIRQAFWSLVKDKKMSPGTCELTPICKALVQLGIVNTDSMPF